MTYVSDIESEQLVLGTILSKSVDVAYWCSVLTPACFTDLHCCAIYQAMQEILERGEEVNISSVDAQIRLHNARVELSIADLMILAQNDHPENFRQAVTVLHQFRVRRALSHLALVIETQAADIYTSPVEQIIEQIQRTIDTLDIAPASHSKSLRDLAPELRQRIEDNLNPATRHVGPLTGMHVIDEEAGLPESGLVVLGGYTSHGKSAIANHIALINARQGKHIAIFSKEMTNLDTLSRMVSMGTEDTAASWIMTRPLNSSHYQQAINELQLLQAECGDRVFFDDSRSLKLDDITSSIRQLHKKHHIKLAFVDYLQLLTYDELHSRNTTQEQLMGQYSRVLKNLGDRLGICIVALSQLNRNVQHMHPSLSVIRDSGQIAEASDYVMFVWRPSVNQLPYDGKYASCPTNDTAMLIVAKNRQGPTLETIIGWKGITTSFHDLSDQQLSQLLHGSTPTAQSKNKQLQRTLFDES